MTGEGSPIFCAEHAVDMGLVVPDLAVAGKLEWFVVLTQNVAASKVGNPVIGQLPAFYRAFHDLYADVILVPRFPWDRPTSSEG
jgi:hypothetical protein